jgi:hypothetical protein
VIIDTKLLDNTSKSNPISKNIFLFSSKIENSQEVSLIFSGISKF